MGYAKSLYNYKEMFSLGMQINLTYVYGRRFAWLRNLSRIHVYFALSMQNETPLAHKYIERFSPYENFSLKGEWIFNILARIAMKIFMGEGF